MPRDTFDKFTPPERGLFGDNEYQKPKPTGHATTGKSDLLDFTLTLRLDDPRKKAIAVSDANSSKLIWLPRSFIEYRAINNGMVEVTLPSWMARDKGLI